MARVVIVRHETEEPALYGAAAALVAAREGGQVFWPESRFDFSRHPDAAQHVAAKGGLVPSGLVWVERLGLPAARPLGELAAWDGLAVVPVHSAFLEDGEVLAGLSAGEERTVRIEGNRFVDAQGQIIGWRDGHGRVRLEMPEQVEPCELTFAIAGPARQFFETCPAPLAALADAIECEAPGSAIRYVDPRQFSPTDFDGVDGVLLPGGSEMSAVAGQVAMAQAARKSGTPIVGLCLGMQSMSTAVARELPGWENADMAEAAPASARHSFVPIESGEYRLGHRETRPVEGTRLARILDDETGIACNHRYRLARELHAGLETRGVRVSALGGTPEQNIADAIEAVDGFYMGMQGHPELSSRPDRPHPLIRAFVAETRNFARARRV